MNNDQKPPVGSVLNSNHPLSQGLVGCWLFNEGGGKPFNLVTNLKAVSMNAGAIWGIGGIYFNGTAGTQLELLPIGYMPATIDSSFSYFTICNNINGNYANFAGSYGKFIFQKSNNTLQTSVGNSAIMSKSFTFSNTNQYSLAMVAIGSLVVLYIDGKSIGNVTLTGLTTVLANRTFRVGVDGDHGYTAPHTVKLSALYDRALSAYEIKSLHENPYQMIQTPQQFFPKSRLIDPTKNAFRWY